MQIEDRIQKTVENVVCGWFLVEIFHAIVTISFSIFAIVIGIQNIHDKCLDNSKIVSLTLSGALVGWSVIIFLGGVGLCINAFKADKKKEKKEEEEKDNTETCVECCIAVFIIIWFVFFSVLLFSNGDCKRNNHELYNTSLAMFIYTFVASAGAWIIQFIVFTFIVSDVVKDAILEQE